MNSFHLSVAARPFGFFILRTSNSIAFLSLALFLNSFWILSFSICRAKSSFHLSLFHLVFLFFVFSPIDFLRLVLLRLVCHGFTVHFYDFHLASACAFVFHWSSIPLNKSFDFFFCNLLFNYFINDSHSTSASTFVFQEFVASFNVSSSFFLHCYCLLLLCSYFFRSSIWNFILSSFEIVQACLFLLCLVCWWFSVLFCFFIWSALSHFILLPSFDDCIHDLIVFCSIVCWFFPDSMV